MVTGVLFLVPVCVQKSRLFLPVSLAALLGGSFSCERDAYLYTLH